MSGLYRVAYSLGFRPWQQAGSKPQKFESLPRNQPAARVRSTWVRHRRPHDRAGEPGLADDRRRQPAQGPADRARPGRRLRADVTFVRGDVTSLRPYDLGTTAGFFADVGCFHHLPRPTRQAMAAAVIAARHREPRFCCSPSPRQTRAAASRSKPGRGRNNFHWLGGPRRRTRRHLRNAAPTAALRPRRHHLGLRPSTPAI